MKKIGDLFRAQAASPTETVELDNGGIGFRIPDYQRPYDWAIGNISRLFTDCLSGFYRLGSSANADAFTFLGTLTLAEQKKRIEEAAAQGMKFSGLTQKLLEEGRRLPLLDPLRDVDAWTPDLRAGRGRNIAELSWDHLWPWLN